MILLAKLMVFSFFVVVCFALVLLAQKFIFSSRYLLFAFWFDLISFRFFFGRNTWNDLFFCYFVFENWMQEIRDAASDVFCMVCAAAVCVAACTMQAVPESMRLNGVAFDFCSNIYEIIGHTGSVYDSLHSFKFIPICAFMKKRLKGKQREKMDRGRRGEKANSNKQFNRIYANCKRSHDRNQSLL